MLGSLRHMYICIYIYTNTLNPPPPARGPVRALVEKTASGLRPSLETARVPSFETEQGLTAHRALEMGGSGQISDHSIYYVITMMLGWAILT
jgi:hypothetical protein